MPLKAALFDVGDTLVESWLPAEQLGKLIRDALTAEFGERPWHDELIAADIEPRAGGDPLLQQTNEWFARWFESKGIDRDGIDMDRLRIVFSIPLDLVSAPVPGAIDAVRWCKEQGLRVILVTNTLSRGDEEVLRDWTRMGLGDAIDGVVSSHSVGWRKPHPAMFERALVLAGAQPSEAFMVGDNLEADVAGAKRLGMRTIWRRTAAAAGRTPEPQPDATVDDLTELPAIVGSWLSVPARAKSNS